MSKTELAKRVMESLLSEQRHPTPLSSKRREDVPLDLPPQVPNGEGRYLPATHQTIEDINAYAKHLKDENSYLALSLSDNELTSITAKAFGTSFFAVDIDQPDESVIQDALIKFADILSLDLVFEEREEEAVYGCWALTGFGTDDLQIGPVRFETRSIWLDRQVDAERVSRLVSRRLRRSWDGQKVRARVSSMDSVKEDGIRRAIGDCICVCSVSSRGLSTKVAQQKTLLSARLALTTIALLWRTPSSALSRMRLLIDGPIFRKNSIALVSKTAFSSFDGTSHIPGQFVTDEWPEVWKNCDWLRQPIGDALTAFLEPQRKNTKPVIRNALFMSIWWFHQACREESNLLATVKFSACLDSLTGGRASIGIKNLISSRLGVSGSSPLTKDGRSADMVVREVYQDARNKAIHGSTDRYGHDWISTRQLAESLSRLCIHSSCDWIYNNPDSDDLAALCRAD